jgi:hypothetical protein
MWKRKLSRDEVLPTFANLQPMKIGIEACAGSHYWGHQSFFSFANLTGFTPKKLIG